MIHRFIKTSKNQTQLAINGFLFHKNTSCEDVIYWKCAKYKSKNCLARAKTVNNEVINLSGEHNHSGNMAHVEASAIMANIREDSKNNIQTPTDIVYNGISNINGAISTSLPSYNNMKRTVERIKKSISGIPSLPSSLMTLILPPEYLLTDRGENFLLYDSGPCLERIIIFGTENNLRILIQNNHWYADGTFKTVPLLFEQLYTIHIIKNGVSIPAVYALLPNKTRAVYSNFLEKVKQLTGDFMPASILTDFESSFILSFKDIYGDSTHRGCFYHFSQCLWRKIASINLKERYETDSEFALKLRHLNALAFVPCSRTIVYFERLVDSNFFDNETSELIDYFEDTWIGRPSRRGTRREPKFKVSMWNCFNNMTENLPKTNNNIEGWHNGFQRLISAHHPNIWNFIKAIKKEQSISELKYEQLLSGVLNNSSRRIYRDAATRLRIIVGMWNENVDPIEYLKSIAHNLTY